MKLVAQRIRGMQDALPEEGKKWLDVLNIALNEAKLYGFKYIRTPVLEQTELFSRSAGDTSDIVNKEMYTFKDRGGRDVCLRPEGTAGVMRAALENGLHSKPLPLKLMYHSSCYRYEKPQQGRYREFFQFGLEILGSSSESADAQLICAGYNIIKKLGIKDVKLSINSIGCSECRAKYVEALKDYLKVHSNELCKTCTERFDRNTLRILDCKELKCKSIINHAPIITDFLCEKCFKSFSILKSRLDALEIAYDVDPGIVRGLDYYNGTVFEFLTEFSGASTAICGGGRYDGLSQTLGGPSLPAVGFGFGMERILAIMKQQSIELLNKVEPLIYIASMDLKSSLKAEKLCEDLRRAGVCAESDIFSRSLKSQMKYADKIGATYAIVIGSEELKLGKSLMKEMKNGITFEIPLDANFIKEVLKFIS